MDKVKEIRVVLSKTDLLSRPGDMTVITSQDIKTYHRVKETLDLIKEVFSEFC